MHRPIRFCCLLTALLVEKQLQLRVLAKTPEFDECDTNVGGVPDSTWVGGLKKQLKQK